MHLDRIQTSTLLHRWERPSKHLCPPTPEIPDLESARPIFRAAVPLQAYLLVSKDKEDGISELILCQHSHQFFTCLIHSFPIIAIHYKNQTWKESLSVYLSAQKTTTTNNIQWKEIGYFVKQSMKKWKLELWSLQNNAINISEILTVTMGRSVTQKGWKLRKRKARMWNSLQFEFSNGGKGEKAFPWKPTGYLLNKKDSGGESTGLQVTFPKEQS